MYELDMTLISSVTITLRSSYIRIIRAHILRSCHAYEINHYKDNLFVSATRIELIFDFQQFINKN